jgi:glycosyltransferase involved in cell wall biosynthesis
VTASRTATRRDDAAGGETPKLSVVLASAPDISDRTPESLASGPIEDFTIIGELFDMTIVDPPIALQSRLARLASRLIGLEWVLAVRTIRAARHADAIIAMDDIGIPLTVLKFLLRSRTPLLMMCHNLQSRKARIVFGRLRFQRFVERFLPYSTTLRVLLEQEYGVPSSRIDLLSNTVDHRYFTPAGEPADGPRVVSAGLCLRDYKTLLEATRDLDVEVVIEAHSIWYDVDISFEEADVHEHVRFSDDGTTAGLRDIYASATLIVVPLLETGQPAGNTTILEGMAMQKPVVATEILMGGDYIEDGETGFLVPAGDPGALRACIAKLLDDYGLRERVGRAARRAVEQRYTRDHFAHIVRASVERAVVAGRS